MHLYFFLFIFFLFIYVKDDFRNTYIPKVCRSISAAQGYYYYYYLLIIILNCTELAYKLNKIKYKSALGEVLNT